MSKAPEPVELQGCPWCAEEWIKVRAENIACFAAECQGCAARGPEADTPDGAIAAWNTRTLARENDRG